MATFRFSEALLCVIDETLKPEHAGVTWVRALSVTTNALGVRVSNESTSSDSPPEAITNKPFKKLPGPD